MRRTWLWLLKNTLNRVTTRAARSGHGPFSLVRHVGRKSGKTYEKRVDYQRGDPRNPFSPEDFVRKFHACADPLIGAKRADRLVEEIDRLERHDDLSKLSSLLAA